MAWREWVGPVAVAILATVGVSFIPADFSLTSGPRYAQSDVDSDYVLLPWAESADHAAILIRYNVTPTHDIKGILDLHRGTVASGAWTYRGDDLQCQRALRCVAQESLDVPLALAAAYDALGYHPTPSNGTFGDDGLLVNITLYAFTSSGHLLATNAPRSQWSGYDLHGDFATISSRTWWFGDGQIAGARDVPLYEPEARALLWGTPVGGVQSAVLEEHEYDWLVGPVWLTARIESVSDPTA